MHAQAQPLAWASLVDQAIALYRAHWRRLLPLAAGWLAVGFATDAALYVMPVRRAIADPAAWGQPYLAPVDAGYWVLLAAGQLIQVGADAALILATLGLL